MKASFLFELAVEGMKQLPYPRGIARFVVSALFRDHARTNKGWAQVPLVPLEVQWFREAITDGSYQAGDEVVLASHLGSGSGRSMFDRNAEAVYLAVEESPHLERWVKLLTSGRRHFYDAWGARGSGYAHEVTEEGWRVFRQELALERKDLVEAWRLRPDRPEMAEEMVYLVQLQNFGEGETPRMWFDRAVALQMDYTPAYYTLLNDLEPRWHGSHEEMLRFARECVETQRYDTPVPALLFETLDRIESDDAVVQEKQRRREFNTRFVLAAAKAGRHEEACERALAMNGDLDAELTCWDPGGPRLLSGRICARASAGDDLETGSSRRSWPRATGCRFCPPRADLAGWEVVRGRWTFEDGRSVLGESASKGMMIRSAARVGPDFEVRGEYELVNSTNDWYQVGVVLGDPGAEGRSWFSLRLKRNTLMGEVATLGTGFHAPHVQAEVPVPPEGTVSSGAVGCEPYQQESPVSVPVERV